MRSPSQPPAQIAPHSSEETGSVVLRFGTAVGLAAIAALSCALPAARRVTAVESTAGPGRAWIGLAAAALLPMVATVVILRGAREGLRAFGGPGRELRAYGVALWGAWLLVTLTLLGSVLRATTHHHALAGVTFAFGALALAIGLGLTSVRVVELLRGASPRDRRAVAIALGAGALGALGWIGLRFLRAASHDATSGPAAGAVVDVLAFALAAGFAARPSFASRRLLAVLGPPAAVAIVALGLSALRDAPLRAAIDERAPVFGALVARMPEP